MRLIEASLGIIMYFYSNLPWSFLFCYLVYSCSNFSSSRIILQMKDVLLLHVFVIVDDDYKISSLPISQTVGQFAILLL